MQIYKEEDEAKQEHSFKKWYRFKRKGASGKIVKKSLILNEIKVVLTSEHDPTKLNF